MNLNIFIGPPGSGKSTLSKTDWTDAVYINQDSQGRDGHLQKFTEALSHKKDIVLDRMNFNKEQRSRYIAPAKAAGFKVKATVLRTPRKVCFERALARKDHETIKDEKGANSALNLFFSKYEYPSTGEGIDEIEFLDFESKEGKTKAIICDLDGTLCNIEHRKHMVQKAIDNTAKGKPNWPAFFRAMSRDGVNEWCADILRRYAGDHEIVYCSGRPEDYRDVTEKWLRENNLYFGHLFMRAAGDYRQDNIVKEILLDFDVLPQFEPLFVLDDRKQVVDMWRKRGLTCLQCAEGNF